MKKQIATSDSKPKEHQPLMASPIHKSRKYTGATVFDTKDLTGTDGRAISNALQSSLPNRPAST